MWLEGNQCSVPLQAGRIITQGRKAILPSLHSFIITLPGILRSVLTIPLSMMYDTEREKREKAQVRDTTLQVFLLSFSIKTIQIKKCPQHSFPHHCRWPRALCRGGCPLVFGHWPHMRESSISVQDCPGGGRDSSKP